MVNIINGLLERKKKKKKVMSRKGVGFTVAIE